MRWYIIKSLLEVSQLQSLHGVRSAQSKQGESNSHLNVQAIGYNWDIVFMDSKPRHNKSNKCCTFEVFKTQFYFAVVYVKTHSGAL